MSARVRTVIGFQIFPGGERGGSYNKVNALASDSTMFLFLHLFCAGPTQDNMYKGVGESSRVGRFLLRNLLCCM